MVNKLTLYNLWYVLGKQRKDLQIICPLHEVFLRKLKMLKTPTFELGKLMEHHDAGGSSGKAARDETGAEAERADRPGPPVLDAV